MDWGVIFFFIWGGFTFWIANNVFENLDNKGISYNGYQWFAFIVIVFFAGMFAFVGLVLQP